MCNKGKRRPCAQLQKKKYFKLSLLTLQRIPTGRKQTSWLFASVAEDLNSGTTCECECFVQRKRFYHPQGCLLLFRPNVDSLLLYQENRDFSKGEWGKETSKITKLRRHLPRNMNKLTCNLRWLKTVSSTYIWMGRSNHSLALDATIMVSKNCSIIGEHVAIIFFDTVSYYSNSMTS